MSDPAIIEAAARALRDAVSDDGPVRGWQDYSRVATAVLAAVTPMIEAAALERAAKVAEEHHKQPDPGSGTDAYWIAAKIRALITKDSGGSSE